MTLMETPEQPDEQRSGLVIVGASDTTTEAPAVEKYNPAVSDDMELFRTSQMVDTLRDTARMLHQRQRGIPVDATTLKAMCEQYAKLRTAVDGALEAPYAQEVKESTPELTDASPIDMIVFATGQLACFIDAINAIPTYEASQLMQKASIDQMRANIAKHSPVGELGVATEPGEPGQGPGRPPGAYL